MKVLWKHTVSVGFWKNRPKLCGNYFFNKFSQRCFMQYLLKANNTDNKTTVLEIFPTGQKNKMWIVCLSNSAANCLVLVWFQTFYPKAYSVQAIFFVTVKNKFCILLFNPFQPSVPFLYPLKTFSRSVEMEH